MLVAVTTLVSMLLDTWILHPPVRDVIALLWALNLRSDVTLTNETEGSVCRQGPSIVDAPVNSAGIM